MLLYILIRSYIFWEKTLVKLLLVYLCILVYFNSCPQLVPMALKRLYTIIKGYVCMCVSVCTHVHGYITTDEANSNSTKLTFVTIKLVIVDTVGFET